MTDREMEIAQKVGPSAFTIYSYLKRFNKNRDVDIQADLGLSHKTVSSVLKKMDEYGKEYFQGDKNELLNEMLQIVKHYNK